MKPFTVSMWNIQGLNSSLFGCKSETPEFKDNTKDTDIIILQETWCRPGSVTHCPPNYREILLSSVKLPTVKRGRDSGGIIIWYKDEISKYITPIKYEHSHIWLKIKQKPFFTSLVEILFAQLLATAPLITW